MNQIDIDAHLKRKAERLEKVIDSLRDLQIIEASEHAKASRVARLRRCVEMLDDAVSEMESIQGDR